MDKTFDLRELWLELWGGQQNNTWDWNSNMRATWDFCASVVTIKAQSDGDDRNLHNTIYTVVVMHCTGRVCEII